MPFEETPRRLRTRKVPGGGLGRLYGTVAPMFSAEVAGMFLKRPRNLCLALGHGGTVETAQSSTGALSGGTVGGPSPGRQSLTGPRPTAGRQRRPWTATDTAENLTCSSRSPLDQTPRGC